jgi:two-component system, NtrC family, sensor histidine kinase HydH
VVTQKIKKIWTLVGLVGLVSLFHFLTPLYQATSHLFFSRFYYLPIILGGLWFGLRGGLGVSFSVTLIYLPYILFNWVSRQLIFWDQLLETSMFNLAGIMIGLLAEKERRQKTLNEELQTLATLGEAAASLALEMKNVIIPIRGFLQKIHASIPPEGKALGYLEIVTRESARLENMTKEMLAFSQKAPLRKEKVETCSLLKEVQQTLTEMFHQKGVPLLVQCPEEGLAGFLDSEKIRQVLINLLKNALEASPSGAEVHLTAWGDDKNLKIEVKDHDSGIIPENLDRVFLPFFTTKPKGAGLGLAVSHGIVEEHGGEISVQSTPEKGTTFSLKIPLLIE